jgi:hypothetical protein
MASYADFLAAKQRRHGTYGTEISADVVSPALHDWQREGVAWAVPQGPGRVLVVDRPRQDARSARMGPAIHGRCG